MTTIKEPRKSVVTVRISGIEKFGYHLECQTSLRVYADRGGPRPKEQLVEEQIQSHVKGFNRKIRGDKMLKIKLEPGSGIFLSKLNIACAMKRRITKLPNFSTIRIQNINRPKDKCTGQSSKTSLLC